MVAENPGHVRSRGEAADLERPIAVRVESALQLFEVYSAVLVLANYGQVGDRLAPRQLVRVVLVRADEDNRPLFRRDPIAQRVAFVQLGRKAEPEHVDEPIDCSGRSRADEDNGMLRLRCTDRPGDDRSRLFSVPRRLEACPGRLRMRIPIQREHSVSDVVLNERK